MVRADLRQFSAPVFKMPIIANWLNLVVYPRPLTCMKFHKHFQLPITECIDYQDHDERGASLTKKKNYSSIKTILFNSRGGAKRVHFPKWCRVPLIDGLESAPCKVTNFTKQVLKALPFRVLKMQWECQWEAWYRTLCSLVAIPLLFHQMAVEFCGYMGWRSIVVQSPADTGDFCLRSLISNVPCVLE